MQIKKIQCINSSLDKSSNIEFWGIEFQRPSNKNTHPWEQIKCGWIDTKPKNGQSKVHEWSAAQILWGMS